MHKMKILVGTLYSGENEYDECVNSIKKQKGVKYEHFVVRNLPNKIAHEALYNRFMDHSNEFDIFIKVDADMIIEDEELFLKIVSKFQANPHLKDLEIAVHDFFSDQLIYGMHAYRNNVKWYQSKEDLFVDYNSIGSDQHIRDDKELAPAALHCKNPSLFHSFHFGIHRALKVIQSGRASVSKVASRFHWQILEKTRTNFLRTRDKRYGFATLGAAIVFRGGIKVEDLDYTNPKPHRIFEKYKTHDEKKLERAVRRVSFVSFGFIGSDLRYKILMTLVRIGRLSFQFRFFSN